MTSYHSASAAYERERSANGVSKPSQSQSTWSDKYRGATVEDLDPPPALSTSPDQPISSALISAYERDYTHLTVISSTSRSLLGYISMPRLRSLLSSGEVGESDPVEKAMLRFNRRKGNVYRVITMETPLEELERFFDGEVDVRNGDGAGNGAAAAAAAAGKEKQEFAVVTDASRKFVLGVATKADLEEFVRRRPT